MKALRISPDLALPLDAVTEKLAWLGRTGSGKTYGAMKLAELMLEAGAQIGALDPVGVWRALRVPTAKGGQTFEVVVFGGLSGDLPLEPSAGELIADLVCERGLSFVLDVSQFIPAEQQRFVQAFGARFFHRKKAAPSAVHLFMEECQEFIPENPSGDEAKTLGVMQRLWKLGRNFGIGGSLISQRPQEIAKKALNMSGTLFAFQMSGPQERAAVKKWVADHDVAVDIEKVLQTLKRGEPHVEMLLETQDGKVHRHSGVVRIAPRLTADLSSTPKVGGSDAARRPLTPIDVAQLKASMAATIEKAKAEDPRELRKKIAEQGARIRALEMAKPAAAPGPRLRVVEKLILKDTLVKQLETLVVHAREASAGTVAHARDRYGRALDAQAKVLKKADEILAALAAAQKRTPELGNALAVGAGRIPGGTPAPARPAPVVSRAQRGNGKEHAPAEGLSGPQQKILDAAAFLESVGIRRPDVVQLALFAGMSASGGYWRANIGRVRTLGLIEGTSLTDAGRAAAREAAIQTVDQLHDHVFTNLLSGPQRAILRVLIDAHPEPLSPDEVGRRANLEPAGGYWRANLGRLRSLGLVSKRGPLQALPVLFLEGAA